MKDFRVLFLYPTQYRVSGLPIGLATLIAVVREQGAEARVFDNAYYRPDDALDQNLARASKGMSKLVNNEDVVQDNSTAMLEDLEKLIAEFKPQLAAITLLEPTFGSGLEMARHIKSAHPEIFIVAGGVFPTLSPELTASYGVFDAICLGEGEAALAELVENLRKTGSPGSPDGLMLKSGHAYAPAKPGRLSELDSLPHPDFTLFDPRLFYKPMQGRLYKMVNVATSRGCPFQCTYCAAPKLRRFFNQNKCGQYYRKFSISRVIEQLKHQIELHNPEFIYFSSETFLAMRDDEFAEFIAAYREIRLPFWIQTRFETMDKKRLRELKEVGLYWLTAGLEHGSEDFRRKVLRRGYKTRVAIEAAKMLRELDQGASLNNIIGFPGETREDVFETIRINRMLYKINRKLESNVFIFTPYRGSDLYKRCQELGLLSDDEFSAWSPAADSTVLNFAEDWKNELQGLLRTFNLYVKLPKKDYPEIRLAEQNSPSGQAALAGLLRKLERS